MGAGAGKAHRGVRRGLLPVRTGMRLEQSEHIHQTKHQVMEEQFEYGELVEVRDHNGEQWRVVGYVGTMPNCKGHWCFPFDQNEKNFDGIPVHWFHVRKTQLK